MHSCIDANSLGGAFCLVSQDVPICRLEIHKTQVLALPKGSPVVRT